jgi:hypothetical protein
MHVSKQLVKVIVARNFLNVINHTNWNTAERASDISVPPNDDTELIVDRPLNIGHI